MRPLLAAQASYCCPRRSPLSLGAARRTDWLRGSAVEPCCGDVCTTVRGCSLPGPCPAVYAGRCDSANAICSEQRAIVQMSPQQVSTAEPRSQSVRRAAA
jgi:hypothetical protein